MEKSLEQLKQEYEKTTVLLEREMCIRDSYSAVLEKASKKTQNTMIDRAYQEKNIPCFSLSDKLLTTEERRPVSYTHLDVYKRQA